MVTTRPRRRFTPSTERRPGVTPVAVLSLAALGVVFGDIGLGVFRIRDRAARVARNPATGEPVKVPAKRVLKFLPSKAIKEAVALKPSTKRKLPAKKTTAKKTVVKKTTIKKTAARSRSR